MAVAVIVGLQKLLAVGLTLALAALVYADLSELGYNYQQTAPKQSFSPQVISSYYSPSVSASAPVYHNSAPVLVNNGYSYNQPYNKYSYNPPQANKATDTTPYFTLFTDNVSKL